VHGTEEARYSQVPALDKALLGATLKGGIELVYQRLDHWLEQLARGCENKLSETALETQQLLLGRMLI
jgi:hypothetical protein